MSQTLTLTAPDHHTFPVYQANPVGTPKGAVVVLQEIFGVNAHIRALADGFAAAGYVALAPATFHRVKPGVELGYEAADM
jgi:carboxymethylenebutenolidase